MSDEFDTFDYSADEQYSSPSHGTEQFEDEDPFGSAGTEESSTVVTLESLSMDSAPLPLSSAEHKDTPYGVWQAKREQELAERREKAQKEKARLKAQAKEDIAKFYAEREQKIAKKKETARADEKAYLKDMAVTMEKGTQWEKITKLIHFSPNDSPSSSSSPASSSASGKGAVSAAAHKQRTERMKKLLLSLKAKKDPEDRKSH